VDLNPAGVRVLDGFGQPVPALRRERVLHVGLDLGRVKRGRAPGDAQHGHVQAQPLQFGHDVFRAPIVADVQPHPAPFIFRRGRIDGFDASDTV